MSTLDHALAYAGRGWPVFLLSEDKIPLRNCWACDFTRNKTGPHKHPDTPEAKEACDCLTCHGFYAATVDEGRVRAMAERSPRGCLAIRTGAPSGLVVVDVDPPEGLRTLAILDEGGLLPGTLMAMTGRESGLHLYYAHPGVKIPTKPGALGKGVDVKGDGGYVIAPPSRHPKTGQRYMWAGDGRSDHEPAPLHPGVVERLRERPRPAPAARAARCGSPRGRLAGLVNTVLNAPPHQANNVLHWAACRCGELIAAGEVDRATAEQALQAAAEERGQLPGEARRTIASGLGRVAA